MMDIDTKRLKSDAEYWDEVAPEIWATEYNLDDGFFFCPKGHWGMSNGGWVSFYKPSTYDLIKSQSNCVSRPTKPAAPEWDGEFPAIGWHGECTWGTKVDWCECVVLPHKRAAVNMSQRGQGWEIRPIDGYEFRPIRTKEQRESDELIQLLSATRGQSDSVIAWAIMAKGYRKKECD